MTDNAVTQTIEQGWQPTTRRSSPARPIIIRLIESNLNTLLTLLLVTLKAGCNAFQCKL